LALVAVRLCDVAPNGASALVTWGMLNLTHRASHAQPTPLVPGERYTVTIPLNVIGYKLPAGHRWRVALSPTYWRHAWPSPRPVTLTLLSGTHSYLQLPVRSPQPQDDTLPPFEPAETAPPLAVETLRPHTRQQTLRRDMIGEIFEYQVENDGGRVRFSDNGLETDDRAVETFTIQEGNPLSASCRVQRTLEYQREGWQVRVVTDSQMTADATHFQVTNQLEGYEGHQRVFTKSWVFKVPRDLV